MNNRNLALKVSKHPLIELLKKDTTIPNSIVARLIVEETENVSQQETNPKKEKSPENTKGLTSEQETESRIKEIILEEINKVKKQQNNAKTIQEFKKFLTNLANQSNEITGASPKEIEQLAQHIVTIIKTLGKGEIATYTIRS